MTVAVLQVPFMEHTYITVLALLNTTTDSDVNKDLGPKAKDSIFKVSGKKKKTIANNDHKMMMMTMNKILVKQESCHSY